MSSSDDFKAEIQAFVAGIIKVFERWLVAQYLKMATEGKPFDPGLFVPRPNPILGVGEIEFDADCATP